MSLVVDASVACKWFFEEPWSKEAKLLAASGTSLIAPDLLLAECANVAWRRVRREQALFAQAEAFLKELPLWFDALTPSAQLHEEAFQIAKALDHPAYDCIYLALAAAKDVPLVTADLAFHQTVEASAWRNRIRSLQQAR